MPARDVDHEAVAARAGSLCRAARLRRLDVEDDRVAILDRGEHGSAVVPLGGPGKPKWLLRGCLTDSQSCASLACARWFVPMAWQRN